MPQPNKRQKAYQKGRETKRRRQEAEAAQKAEDDDVDEPAELQNNDELEHELPPAPAPDAEEHVEEDDVWEDAVLAELASPAHQAAERSAARRAAAEHAVAERAASDLVALAEAAEVADAIAAVEAAKAAESAQGRRVNDPDNDNEAVVCPICLEDVQRCDIAVLEPCGHSHFHEKCITTYFDGNPRARNCPSCRAATTEVQHNIRIQKAYSVYIPQAPLGSKRHRNERVLARGPECVERLIQKHQDSTKHEAEKLLKTNDGESYTQILGKFWSDKENIEAQSIKLSIKASSLFYKQVHKTMASADIEQITDKFFLNINDATEFLCLEPEAERDQYAMDMLQRPEPAFRESRLSEALRTSIHLLRGGLRYLVPSYKAAAYVMLALTEDGARTFNRIPDPAKEKYAIEKIISVADAKGLAEWKDGYYHMHNQFEVLKQIKVLRPHIQLLAPLIRPKDGTITSCSIHGMFERAGWRISRSPRIPAELRTIVFDVMRLDLKGINRFTFASESYTAPWVESKVAEALRMRRENSFPTALLAVDKLRKHGTHLQNANIRLLETWLLLDEDSSKHFYAMKTDPEIRAWIAEVLPQCEHRSHRIRGD